MNGDFPAKDTVYTPYIPINVWFWPTLCICGLTLHTGCAVCYLLKVGTMNHVYIWHGVYMAILAGKSPNEWSIMVYIYRSGQPCTCFTCSIVTHVKNASKWRSRKAVYDGACQKTHTNGDREKRCSMVRVKRQKTHTNGDREKQCTMAHVNRQKMHQNGDREKRCTMARVKRQKTHTNGDREKRQRAAQHIHAHTHTRTHTHAHTRTHTRTHTHRSVH